MKTIREKQEDKKKHKRKTLTWLRIGEWESNPMSEDVDNEGKNRTLSPQHNSHISM